MRAILAALALLLPAPIAHAVPWQSAEVPATDAPAKHSPGATTLWYRCYLKVPDRLVTPAGDERDLWRSSMVLALADLPGAIEVSLNGQRIATHPGLAVGEEKRFKVPPDILRKDTYNALVIRVESIADRGMTVAPVFLDYFNELVLDGAWGLAIEEPPAPEFEPSADPPPAHSHGPGDFRLSSRPLASTDAPMPGRKVSPEVALELLETDDDLTVDALLSEPEVAQPTHLSFDARGRMWIAQYRQYPFPAGVKMLSRDQYYRSKYDRAPPAPPHHDRGADIVSVHEDNDGDGIYETSKNVLEGLNMTNAALHGWGGIWVMHTPHLLFYPDADGDDIPDRDPEVRLTGFGLEDTHSTANGLAWGPDGWLYGGQGSTTTSRITRPGSDDAPIYNEGPIVWRYHPETRTFEVFADGGGNTFGLSFDAEGRLFSGHNGGNTRGFHFVQGGQYLKQGKNPGKFGPPPNPFSFGELEMMKSANPIPRFSHLAIVVDADAMPDRLQGKLLSIDPLHHTAIASDRIPTGSTFSTADIGTPLRSDDKTFRPVYLANAPCGGVILADFREEYIAHGQNYQGQIDPDSGRIYRLRDKTTPLVKDRDLNSKSPEELVATLAHSNLWHRQTAARLLGERADPATVEPLRELLKQSATHPALEALWALHQMGRLDAETARTLLDHPAPMVRSWAIRLRGDAGSLEPDELTKLREMARTEPSAEVRCQILSTAMRLPHRPAALLARKIVARPDDIHDPFIPLMAWHLVESLGDQAVDFVHKDEIWSSPFTRKHLTPRIMRRFAEAGSRADLLRCAKLLELAPTDADRAALMEGFEQAFAGRTIPDLPDELVAKLGKTSLSTRIRSGEVKALSEGIETLSEPSKNPSKTLEAVRAFGSVPDSFAEALLTQIAVGERATTIEARRAAITSLQIYTAPEVGTTLAKAYPTLRAELRPAARNLLASRAHWAVAMLDTVPGTHFEADLLARLALHSDDTLNSLLAKKFPTVDQPAPAARAEAIRTILAAHPGDPYAGEPLYTQRCASCHKLFFKGGAIGPDLTRYQRDDLGAMLISIVDPNAEIREGFENVLVTTKDGRILSGFLSDEDKNSVVLRGFDGADITIPRANIKFLQPAGRSLMPTGLLDGLDDKQLRDLFAYLRISQPISK